MLAGAWLAIAVVAFHTIYAPWTLAILVVAVVLVLGSVWFGGLRSAPARSVVIAVTLATPVTIIASPLLPNVNRTDWLLPAVVAGVVVVPLGLVVLARPRWWPAVLGLTAVVCAGIILGGTPRIDVWVILQDTANGLLRHQDPYRMSFPNVPPGQTSSCFNYLPSTFLLTAPGRWLFGDVRWVEAGCVVASAALLARHVRSTRGLPLAVLVGVLPCTLLVVQQAWTEPMLLLSLCATAVAVDRGWRWWLAPAALGVGLANKQHAVVLLPFLLLYRDFGPRRTLTAVAAGTAITLPWVLADAGRFKTCVADFYLGESAPTMSLSVWRWLPDGWQLPILLAGTAAVTVLALRRCPRGGAGLLSGSGLVLATFDLLNKQTFANQWWLASALLVAGLAIGHGDAATAPAEPWSAPSVHQPRQVASGS